MGPIGAGIARQIMGKNFIGIEEASQCLKLQFTKEQLRALRAVPFSTTLLQRCSKTHILFPGFPLTIQELNGKVGNVVHKTTGVEQEGVMVLGLRPNEVLNQDFAATTKTDLRWYLMSKSVAEETTFFTSYLQQKELIRQKGAELPNACELAYLIALYKLARGKLLDFNGCWINFLDQNPEKVRSYYQIFNKKSGRYESVMLEQHLAGFVTESGLVFEWSPTDDNDGSSNVGTIDSIKPLNLDLWRDASERVDFLLDASDINDLVNDR